MNADGNKRKNITNTGVEVYDDQPDFSPDGTKITFRSEGPQASNPEGDIEVYVMSALDGSGQVNLSNNNADIPDGTRTSPPTARRSPTRPGTRRPRTLRATTRSTP